MHSSHSAVLDLSDRKRLGAHVEKFAEFSFQVHDARILIPVLA